MEPINMLENGTFITNFQRDKLIKKDIEVFNRLRLIDMSALPFAHIDSYSMLNSKGVFSVASAPWFMRNNMNYTNIAFVVMFAVAAERETDTYTVITMDELLGVIGGMAALIWSICGFFVGNYEQHKMETSYMRNFFSVEK